MARRTTEEFLDRWRTPGDVRSKVWEERFGETRYTSLGVEAWEAALKDAGLAADQIDHVDRRRARTSARRARSPRSSASPPTGSSTGSAATVGNTGAAHPALLLARRSSRPGPGR